MNPSSPAILQEKLDRLSALKPDLYNRDFLSTWTHGEENIRFILLAAEIFQELACEGISARVFDTGVGVSIFRDKSTRTRYSFRAACNMLGLGAEEIDESTSQVAHGETVRETAAMLGFLTEVMGIRDDLFPGEGHRFMTEVAASLAESFECGVLPARPTVINLQSDLDHPTQSLSDLRHLGAIWGGLEHLRGKKIAMTWAYSPSYGKPLSVPQGIIALMPRFGMHVSLAYPKGYDLMEEPVAQAKQFAAVGGGSFEIVGSMEEAFQNADFVYPKSWAPAHIMQERTRLLRSGAHGKLAELEREALACNAQFKHWECNSDKMRLSKGGEALYMHCLPADVSGVNCEAGEVSRDVFEKARLDTYREAGRKPHIIAAMILGMRLRDPEKALRQILASAPEKRLGEKSIAAAR